MHTLESVHGVKLDFDNSSVEEIKALGESSQIIKNSIVKESAFNSEMQNPEYTKNLLIMEAVKIYLAEIAPKRLNKKNSVKESTLEEGPRGMGVASRDWALNKKSTDVRHGGHPVRSIRQPGEISKSDARDQAEKLSKKYFDQGGKITRESLDPDKVVKATELGRKMMDYSQNATGTDDKELRILNAISQVGEKLTQLGTPFGPKTLTDIDRRVIEVARRRMAASGVAEDVVAPAGPNATTTNNKTQPGMVNVQKGTDMKTVPAAQLANMQKQGYSIVGDEIKEDDSIESLYAKYGIDEGKKGKDQDGDGDNDFADIMITRMMTSGKSKKDAIVKTHNKSYNNESMMEAKKLDLAALKKKKAELEDKMDKITENGGKVLRTDPLKKQYDKVCADIKAAKKTVNEAVHMEHHDDYQASMARSELYRNTKYAMDMLKMIGPDADVPAWISANLTKAAETLDKVYHYMDYHLTFEAPATEVSEDADMVPGDAGSIARQNLMMIMEYSTKLFRMIQPGDKLEGWVAMKLTSASEAVSSSKHHLEYVQFEKHAGEMAADMEAPVEETKKDVKESIGTMLMKMMLNEEQDLEQAETLLAAKSMSDELQGIAEKIAKMSVDSLMPLVDTMKEQFGQEIGTGFNDVIKATLDAALKGVTEAKEGTDNAILAVQQGQVPGLQTDLDNATELPNPGEGDEAPEFEPEDEAGDEFGSTQAASGEEEEPLGRSKKGKNEVPDELEESAVKEGGNAENKAKKKAVIDPKKRPKDVVNKFDPRSDLKPVKKGPGSTVKEAKKAKPDFLDLDKDGNKKEPMKKAVADKKKATKECSTSMVEESKMEKGLRDDMPRIVHGVKGVKSTKFTRKFPNAKAMDKWLDSDAGSNCEVHTIEIDHSKTKKHVKESNVNEVAPPGKAAEKFIKDNKESFRNRYGSGWEKILYATAWKKFGNKSESYKKANTMLNSASAKRNELKKAFEAHKVKHARMVTEGKVSDILGTGYGLEGEGILNQINETNTMINKLREMIKSELNAGVYELATSVKNNALAAKLAESKSVAPFGIVWKNGNKKNEKFFETADLRAYWMDFNRSIIKEHKLINPADFDKRIASLTKKKG